MAMPRLCLLPPAAARSLCQTGLPARWPSVPVTLCWALARLPCCAPRTAQQPCPRGTQPPHPGCGVTPPTMPPCPRLPPRPIRKPREVLGQPWGRALCVLCSWPPAAPMALGSPSDLCLPAGVSGQDAHPCSSPGRAGEGYCVLSTEVRDPLRTGVAGMEGTSRRRSSPLLYGEETETQKRRWSLPRPASCGREPPGCGLGHPGRALPSPCWTQLLGPRGGRGR